LKPEVSKELLADISKQQSDNKSAQKIQNEKEKLLENLTKNVTVWYIHFSIILGLENTKSKVKIASQKLKLEIKILLLSFDLHRVKVAL